MQKKKKKSAAVHLVVLIAYIDCSFNTMQQLIDYTISVTHSGFTI